MYIIYITLKVSKFNDAYDLVCEIDVSRLSKESVVEMDSICLHKYVCMVVLPAIKSHLYKLLLQRSNYRLAMYSYNY